VLVGFDARQHARPESISTTATTKRSYVILFDPSQESKNFTELDERADNFYGR
jgi:hypothetical protein